LSLVRWTENYHLFFLGALSFIVATIARIALRQSWRSRLRVHLASMGLSYILMLTAFYVDNGKNLPLWRELPQWAFWVLPAAVGVPIIMYLMLRHSLMRQPAAR
jgi:glucan phosphoethanolaminetransferase (alkaline phosphatase superfamily)